MGETTTKPKDPKSNAVIITGMHRSGTSLTASILQKAGVDIGERLLGAGLGNVRGHFEDVDFWSLHKEILISQGISSEGWTTLSKIDVPDQFITKAKALCDERTQQGGVWGWKEPRTTLFLDFWKEIIPNAKYVFVYREPWEVVDSLFLRGDGAFINNPSLAVHSWVAYNTAILNFYKLNSDSAVLIHLNHLQGKAFEFMSLVKEKLQLEILPVEEELYDGNLIHRNKFADYRVALLCYFYPNVIDIFDSLNAVADLPLQNNQTELNSPLHLFQDWALQDWFSAHRLAREQSQLQQTQSQLQQTQSQLQQTQSLLQSQLQEA
ncbi:MAG TPA: sulfotransferase, partial [Phormidium sp.]